MNPEQASSTARLIAESTVLLARQPDIGDLVPARAAALCAQFTATTSARTRLWRQICGIPACQRWLERLSIPGIQLHYALRKRLLEEMARAALADGLTQLIVLGAGFDTLAWRLHDEFPHANFIEIDHPATQREKQIGFGPNWSAPANFHLLPLDLTRRTLAATLDSAECFQPSADTLFIAEGLLMYLTPDEVDELFQVVRQNSGPRGRFAFTFMETQADGRIAFHNSTFLVDFWLRWRGEPFRWGLRHEQMSDWLSARGFRLRELAGADDLRERYLTPRGWQSRDLAEGEGVCLAERF